MLLFPTSRCSVKVTKELINRLIKQKVPTHNRMQQEGGENKLQIPPAQRHSTVKTHLLSLEDPWPSAFWPGCQSRRSMVTGKGSGQGHGSGKGSLGLAQSATGIPFTMLRRTAGSECSSHHSVGESHSAPEAHTPHSDRSRSRGTRWPTATRQDPAQPKLCWAGPHCTTAPAATPLSQHHPHWDLIVFFKELISSCLLKPSYTP